MMPMPMGGPGAAPEMPAPGGPPAPGGGGKPDPKMIEGEIVKMLQEARKVAEQAGLSWEDLLSRVQQRPNAPAPRMPAGAPSAPPELG